MEYNFHEVKQGGSFLYFIISRGFPNDDEHDNTTFKN